MIHGHWVFLNSNSGFSPVGHGLVLLTFLMTLIFTGQLLRQRRAVGSTIAWLLLIVLLPYVGLPLYILVGYRKIQKTTLKPVTLKGGSCNDLRFLFSGEDVFTQLRSLIEGAKSHIFIETYVFRPDEAVVPLLELIENKAREGCDIRLLIDGYGTFFQPVPWIWRLRRAGVKVVVFNRFFRELWAGQSNLRNHRKAVIVDGRAALTGGLNWGREYLGPAPSAGRWIDLATLIAGPATKDLENLFLADWEYAGGSPKFGGSSESVSPAAQSEAVTNDEIHQGTDKVSVVDILPSGPNLTNDPIYDVILSETFQERHRMMIVTPYFVPDETLTKSLEIAARRGVKIEILTPARSNHLLADFARLSFLRQLHEAGIKIFYFNRMIHAKAVIFDERLALTGSANFDVRSLLVNYELGVALKSSGDVAALREWFAQLVAQSVAYTPPNNRFREILEGIGRILSPML